MSIKKFLNEHVEKQKKRLFLMSQGSFNPKNRFLCQKVCPVASGQTDTQTHTRARARARESDYLGTLSEVQEFFLQPIIKDRPN